VDFLPRPVSKLLRGIRPRAVEKALIDNARTGRTGDGKILVQPLEQVESHRLIAPSSV